MLKQLKDIKREDIFPGIEDDNITWEINEVGRIYSYNYKTGVWRRHCNFKDIYYDGCPHIDHVTVND